jgi:hypothetical protein
MICWFFLKESKSNLTTVTLYPLSYTTSGVYRCEVSTEAPHFKIVFQHSNMTILGKMMYLAGYSCLDNLT